MDSVKNSGKPRTSRASHTPGENPGSSLPQTCGCLPPSAWGGCDALPNALVGRWFKCAAQVSALTGLGRRLQVASRPRERVSGAPPAHSEYPESGRHAKSVGCSPPVRGPAHPDSTKYAAQVPILQWNLGDASGRPAASKPKRRLGCCCPPAADAYPEQPTALSGLRRSRVALTRRLGTRSGSGGVVRAWRLAAWTTSTSHVREGVNMSLCACSGMAATFPSGWSPPAAEAATASRSTDPGRKHIAPDVGIVRFDADSPT